MFLFRVRQDNRKEMLMWGDGSSRTGDGRRRAEDGGLRTEDGGRTDGWMIGGKP